MDGINHAAPCRDLLLSINTWDVGISARAWGDYGSFSDNQSSRHRRTLRIVILNEGKGDVSVIGTEPGHGRHGDAMGQLQASDLDGGEEFRHGDMMDMEENAIKQGGSNWNRNKQILLIQQEKIEALYLHHWHAYLIENQLSC